MRKGMVSRSEGREAMLPHHLTWESCDFGDCHWEILKLWPLAYMRRAVTSLNSDNYLWSQNNWSIFGVFRFCGRIHLFPNQEILEEPRPLRTRNTVSCFGSCKVTQAPQTQGRYIYIVERNPNTSNPCRSRVCVGHCQRHCDSKAINELPEPSGILPERHHSRWSHESCGGRSRWDPRHGTPTCVVAICPAGHSPTPSEKA